MEPVPSLHARIAAAFDDQEVRTLCFDRFPIVYHEFTTGMTHTQMIGLLLDYCMRQNAGEALLDALEQARPGLIGADRDALLASLDSARFDSGPGTTPGQTIAVAGDRHNVDTGGGDYAGYDIDKRQGAFVSGGMVQGNVVGTNLGTVTANYYTQSAASQPALHQLRAPVGDFVGRESEIAQLVQAARSGAAAAISGVRGMGGIGKTELAYVVAHQLASDFPDAQIVVDLRGASDPLAPVQALLTLIRAFEPERRLPDDLAELEGLYRSLLNGKRVLILADNAHDAAQVRPLLPPMGCALLITSRQRFTLPGMHTFDLEMLMPGEAVQLLLAICPRIGEAAPALATLCGNLPLALRISAGLLASDATLPVARYLERLGNERLRLAALRDGDDPALDVDASLTLSYAALDPPAQAILCQLSVFVADFDRAAAQAVVTWEGEKPANMLTRLLQRVFARPRPVASIEVLLGELYRRSLLDYDAKQERYSLHDLVRVFARSRLGVEATEASMLRYAQHYVQITNRVNNLYHQGGKSIMAGLALFDRERIHFNAGWAWVCEELTEPAIDELLIAYTYVMAHIGDLRYDLHREQVPWLEAALAAAQRRGHRVVQSNLLDNLGNAYMDIGELQRASELYEQHLLIVRDLGDRHGEGNALGNLGTVYRNLGEVERAIDCFEQQLEIARGLADRHGEGSALGGLGNAYYSLREMRQAIACYEQQLTITRAIGDRHEEGNALGGLGNAYENLGEVRRAIDCYEQQLAITRTVGDRQGEARASWNLGKLLIEHGDLVRAIALMQIRVDYERSIRHAEAEAHAAWVEELRRQLQAAAGTAPPEPDAPPEAPPA